MSTQRREGIDHTSGAGGSLGWRNVWNLAADGNLKTLKRLQRSELLAHVNDTDHAQKTALHYAAYAGRAETCEFLQQCGAAIDVADAQGKTPPDLARERRHVEVARQLEGFEAREVARLRREREEREAEVRRREAEAVARAAREARGGGGAGRGGGEAERGGGGVCGGGRRRGGRGGRGGGRRRVRVSAAGAGGRWG